MKKEKKYTQHSNDQKVTVTWGVFGSSLRGISGIWILKKKVNGHFHTQSKTNNTK